MNRRSFLRALGFGLPAAGVCAAIPSAPDHPLARLAVRMRTRPEEIEWYEVPEMICVRYDAPVPVIRVVQGGGSEHWGVADASTFPKA